MTRLAWVLAGVVALVGFWVWSQKGPKPVVDGEYIRVKTVVDKDEGKLRFLIAPVGVSAVSLSAFSVDAILDREAGKPILNQELIEAGWSFPIAAVENRTVKLAGVYISPSSYMLTGEQEIAVAPIEDVGRGEVTVRLGEENTKFLKKDATGIKFKYE